MSRTIIFEHIPKTGGITLRGILYKVYGEKQMFVINSNNPGASLDAFTNLDEDERKKIKVIAGHGALLYEKYLTNPFKITILREPLSLFLSQYYYLKISKKDSFWEDVQKMDSPLEYLAYALAMGQDNLMTRFLANAMDWTVDDTKSFHNMNQDGENLLKHAKSNLAQFDAVINLTKFDKGVFALSRLLGWPHIPLYKPRNRTPKKPNYETPGPQILKQLRQALLHDMDLYNYFTSKNLDISGTVNQNSIAYRVFQTRQSWIKIAIKAMAAN